VIYIHAYHSLMLSVAEAVEKIVTDRETIRRYRALKTRR
jgi:hypothetical protein